ncbi:hypothetical protein [Pseudonocardia sp. WMMC193]|uniref:hypothetical protein n=1 Tax=Pseudonocardia sp. WMMC193 TaxID=2911965 RepID=UPI001F200E59|nr:hypothetical protein [Pseudonocardia sp. WMMC193]MCF7551433.1 hypothetical protein [Pseudonocardia sp. WMMC193]
MSAFRFFGRPEPAEREIAPDSATGHARPARRAEDLLAPPPQAWGGPPHGAAGGWPAAPEPYPETRPGPVDTHGWAGAPVGGGWSAAPEPHPEARPGPMDTHGWAPVGGGWSAPTEAPRWTGTPAHMQDETPYCACTVREGDPHPAEAAALATAFAADYLSWDEDDPDLRAHVLGEYLAARRPVLLGWSGQGRQRADFAVPGVVRPDGDGRVLVDVRVRVTPYRRVPGGRPLPPDDPDEDGPTVPAAAPAPAARGWRGLPGRWVRLSVAVLAAGDRLVVDAEDESEDPWVEPAPELADDLPEETL